MGGITRKGNPLVREGSEVKKGEILVSGSVEVQMHILMHLCKMHSLKVFVYRNRML